MGVNPLTEVILLNKKPYSSSSSSTSSSFFLFLLLLIMMMCYLLKSFRCNTNYFIRIMLPKDIGQMASITCVTVQVTARYSEGSLFLRFEYTEGSLFRRYVIPKVRYSDGQLF